MNQHVPRIAFLILRTPSPSAKRLVKCFSSCHFSLKTSEQKRSYSQQTFVKTKRFAKMYEFFPNGGREMIAYSHTREQLDYCVMPSRFSVMKNM
jgi:hypothetical protein